MSDSPIPQIPQRPKRPSKTPSNSTFDLEIAEHSPQSDTSTPQPVIPLRPKRKSKEPEDPSEEPVKEQSLFDKLASTVAPLVGIDAANDVDEEEKTVGETVGENVGETHATNQEIGNQRIDTEKEIRQSVEIPTGLDTDDVVNDIDEVDVSSKVKGEEWEGDNNQKLKADSIPVVIPPRPIKHKETAEDKLDEKPEPEAALLEAESPVVPQRPLKIAKVIEESLNDENENTKDEVDSDDEIILTGEGPEVQNNDVPVDFEPTATAPIETAPIETAPIETDTENALPNKEAVTVDHYDKTSEVYAEPEVPKVLAEASSQGIKVPVSETIEDSDVQDNAVDKMQTNVDSKSGVAEVEELQSEEEESQPKVEEAETAKEISPSEVLEEKTKTQENVSTTETEQIPVIPSRPSKQPSIPSRPVKSKTNSSEVVPSASPAIPHRPVKSDETKKAPPPKPKKLSSKIAAFQQMFNQPAPEAPKPDSRGVRSSGRLSSDKKDFASNLQNMMGRGIALPGMANPEMLQKLKASNEEETTADTTSESIPGVPRRARGPKGKRLPKAIQETTVTVESPYKVSVHDVWEIEFTKKEINDEVEVVQENASGDIIDERFESDELDKHITENSELGNEDNSKRVRSIEEVELAIEELRESREVLVEALGVSELRDSSLNEVEVPEVFEPETQTPEKVGLETQVPEDVNLETEVSDKAQVTKKGEAEVPEIGETEVSEDIRPETENPDDIIAEKTYHVNEEVVRSPEGEIPGAPVTVGVSHVSQDVAGIEAVKVPSESDASEIPGSLDSISQETGHTGTQDGEIIEDAEPIKVEVLHTLEGI